MFPTRNDWRIAADATSRCYLAWSSIRGAAASAAGEGTKHPFRLPRPGRTLSDGGQALLISHGGLIEPGLVAVLPTWHQERWGRDFRHGEGVRLYHSGTDFDAVEILVAITNQ